jgi:hypothetical protein
VPEKHQAVMQTLARVKTADDEATEAFFDLVKDEFPNATYFEAQYDRVDDIKSTL